MGNNKFYTPDGFCDSMPAVCEFKKETEAKLRKLFGLHGYSEIETPGIEYIDVYTDNNFVDAKELYKLCDHKGRLICMRYDGTVPAARFAATIYKDVKPPLRLCYIENMYRFNQANVGGGRQSEFTQAGVELMGSRGSEADAEVIALGIESALEMGLEDLQISIGQVKVFSGLMNQLNIDSESADKIRSAISQKNVVSIDKICQECGISEEDKKTILMISEEQGTYDVIDAFRNRITDAEAIKALDNLKEILDILDDYGYSKYVSIDLGLLSNIDYYTGMIFKGYTYEVGFAILSGGRYDNATSVFGRDMESVGFSLGVSLAIIAMMRQGFKPEASKAEVIIGYDKTVAGTRKAAIALANQMMAEGSSVILDSAGMNQDELEAYADENEICATIYINETQEDSDKEDA